MYAPRLGEGQSAARGAADDPVDKGHDRVEVGSGDGAEHEDQHGEAEGRGDAVFEQLQAGVVGEPAGGDPGSDDDRDEESGSEEFGEQAREKARVHRLHLDP